MTLRNTPTPSRANYGCSADRPAISNSKSLRFGTLFSGIGGWDLGLERAGMACVWQVEIDAWCRRVLAKHWPNAERFADVHFVSKDQLAPVDVIAASFPCQDLSCANTKGKGLKGHRSGLWREARRIIGEVTPAFVAIENVWQKWRSWVPFVRRDLFSLGYSSLPIRLRASDFGAPHQRARCIIVAAANAHSDILRLESWRGRRSDGEDQAEFTHAADAQRSWSINSDPRVAAFAADTDAPWKLESCRSKRTVGRRPIDCDWWIAEPRILRVVHGRTAGMDRSRREAACGNAIVFQKAEWIGRTLIDAISQREAA